MRRQCARVFLTALTAWGALALAGIASAQVPQLPQPTEPTPTIDAASVRQQQQIEALKKTVDEQNQKIEQLMKVMQGLTTPTSAPAQPATAPPSQEDINKAVDKALKDQAEKKKAEDAAKAAEAKHKWYEVGTDLKMTAKWYDGLYLQTENKDFWTHIGGWVQYDNYWWTQDAALKSTKASKIPKNIQTGLTTQGIGALEDGDIWRRLRIQMEGGFWEVFEYNLIFAFENDQWDMVGLDEFWVGITKLPLIGNIRAGHVKIEQGLEGDMLSSSRCMTFLERSSYTDAFYENFGTGLWFFNGFFDDRVFLGGNVYRQDAAGQQISEDFGDGEYAYVGRVAALPWYSANGRCLTHLAASYSWRKAQTTDPTGATNPDIHAVRFRARPEMRDADPAGSLTDANSGNILGGNKSRLVDTGAIQANSSSVVGLEYLTVLGPFSVQAEYAWATINDAVINKKAAGDFTFNGGYVQLAYTLTGENRSYDRRIGRLDSYYFGRRGIYTPFWAVRDADGNLDWGLGAWELAARWSYLNLNDGIVQGGKEEGWSLGLNWYMTSDLKLQFQYQWNNRYDVPGNVIPGSVNGFGIRMQLVF
jgi:phosphate-selective porin OprO/OprP